MAIDDGIESRKKEVIGIIGGGISGLLACKYCISKGFDPIVFESESSIGGVWTKTMGSTKLQTPKPFYQFSDYPWPESVTEMFPDQQTVLEYIESYASHFDLIRHIQFNNTVLNLSYECNGNSSISGDGEWNLWGDNGDVFNSNGKWNVSVQDTRTLSTQVPNIPEFPQNKGPEAFEGEVIHSMDYSKMDPKTAANFVRGKHVAVVGFLRSGQDIARECSMVNVPEGFYDRVEEGSIKLIKKAENFGFSKEGIVFEGQAEPVKFDLVILATGFKGIDKLKHIFESPNYQEFIAGSDDSTTVPLYRECIHPLIPQLAIIGFSESLSNLFTSEIRCLDGKFKLPSIEVMEKDIGEWDKYKKRYSYRKYYRRSCIGALHIWHTDQLCKDIGWNPKRKKGRLAEWFQPYGPQDYSV
ncbi:hypothetical protein T459_33549 [Capsicum annuum]|uniref:Flavin-containing monooxygenase n=1 Tax=Capsicum annuum TaxID=4072 RepID=A0A2G2XYI9_CAPAN|nr:putative flavin-containing monooxygenase 1-like [Capsicum annuum]PHT62578.1 hypothetical protein T459_33549 [Capsicum annuum]